MVAKKHIEDYILCKKMEIVRNIVKIGLKERQKLKIPLRQPLHSVTISQEYKKMLGCK